MILSRILNDNSVPVNDIFVHNKLIFKIVHLFIENDVYLFSQMVLLCMDTFPYWT